ncbi:MAG: hypothetical protein E7589_06660 [Ruminococcaceae bacterium]|nr:hypothetical protein [Oscillospiraceae bacterium]
MKEIIYSVRNLASEEVTAELEAALKEAVLQGENEKLKDAVRDVQVSWLGERIILSVDKGWNGEASQLFEQVAEAQCLSLGATLVTPAVADTYVLDGGKKAKAPKRVSFTSAVAAMITAVVLAVLVTFSVTTAFIRQDTPDTVTPGGEEDNFAYLDVIDRLFRSASLFSEKLDDGEIASSVLKAYVSATGDRYARYYTAEEYAQMLEEQSGNMCGIGVTVVAGSVELDGVEYVTIEVIYVTPDSPAQKAGVAIGDHVYAIGNMDDAVTVDSVGYAEAVDMLLGEEGTDAEFIVYRKDDKGGEYLPITATREQIKTQSVMFSICDTDKSVGIVRITGFDETTAEQLDTALETLENSGCEYFVLDLRNNGGGMLTSVEDCMMYFLEKGDTIIRVKDRSGTETSSKVLGGGIDGYRYSGSGDIEEKDVGKYKNLKMILLVNGYTASAAELFTANFHDYGLGETVGTTTYGKGSVQTTLPLKPRYGIDGALKLTTRFYYPAKGDGFDGKGITPDYPLELSEEAASYHPNLLPDSLDNQLQKAITEIKK